LITNLNRRLVIQPPVIWIFCEYSRFISLSDLHTFFIISWEAVKIIVSAERKNAVFAGYGVTAFVWAALIKMRLMKTA